MSTSSTVESNNFGGVESRSGGDPEQAEVVFVQAPVEGSVSYGGGTGAGPSAILHASRQVETYDDETGIRLEDLSFAVGPVVTPTTDDPEAYAAQVQQAVRPIVQSGRVPFVLGGEHSVTIGAVRAVREKHAKAHLLSIDAHADLRDSYGGSTHSHACIVRRLMDGGSATIIGVRSYSGEEARFAATASGLTMIPAREAMRESFHVDEFVASLGDLVYVTFDVDGLDPSIVGATGTPEPGGLSWFRALEILEAVFRRRRVVGLDVVELAPTAGSQVSEFATARLVAKMLSYRSAGGAA
jgi:agmatinase